MVWLQDAWGHLDSSRQDLLADALERLGRFEEGSLIRQQMFERTFADFYFQRWREQLPETRVRTPSPTLANSRSATTT